MFWSVLILVVIIAFILWVILDKKSQLAAAIRARFHGAKAQATDLLDDANSQMEAAEVEIDSKLTRTRNGLITVKSEGKAAKRKIDETNADIEQWKNGVTSAVKAGDRDLARDCLARQKESEALLPALQAQYDQLIGQEKTMNEAYEELERQKRVIGQQKSSIKARTIVAKSQQDVNDLLAGINAGGQSNSVARAMELVEKAEDKASATGEVRTEFQKDQDLKTRLAGLSQKEDLDTELDRLFQENKS